MKRPIATKSADAQRVDVKVVNGKVLDQPGALRQFPRGDDMMMVEVTVPKGFATPPHKHDHETICYLVKGKIEVEIGGEKAILHAGDQYLHQKGVMHGMQVLEDSVWLEIKTPAPDRRSPEGVWLYDKK